MRSPSTITFYGSKDTWDKVTKPDNEEYLKKATYIFDENHVAPPEDIMGDVNKDGAFNVSDLVLFDKWLLGDPSAELKDWKAADFDKDEQLDTFDLVRMRQELVK